MSAAEFPELVDGEEVVEDVLSTRILDLAYGTIELMVGDQEPSIMPVVYLKVATRPIPNGVSPVLDIVASEPQVQTLAFSLEDTAHLALSIMGLLAAVKDAGVGQ